MSTATCVFIWLLAVIGLYELLFALVSFLFLAPEEKSCGAVELRGHMENTEFLIRSALLRHSGTVYIIDFGADSETLFIAQLFAQNCERLVLLRAENTVAVFGEDTVQ